MSAFVIQQIGLLDGAQQPLDLCALRGLGWEAVQQITRRGGRFGPASLQSVRLRRQARS